MDWRYWLKYILQEIALLNSIQIYLYSTFSNQSCHKADVQ